MHRKVPVQTLIYNYLYPRPSSNDPPNFSNHLARNLIPEIRIETARFYGSLDAIEARYPGLNYTHPPHIRRLMVFPHHARLFHAIARLRITNSEVLDLARWEGTLWARERYEKDEGFVVLDTTGDDIGEWQDPRKAVKITAVKTATATSSTTIRVTRDLPAPQVAMPCELDVQEPEPEGQVDVAVGGGMLIDSVIDTVLTSGSAASSSEPEAVAGAQREDSVTPHAASTTAATSLPSPPTSDSGHDQDNRETVVAAAALRQALDTYLLAPVNHWLPPAHRIELERLCSVLAANTTGDLGAFRDIVTRRLQAEDGRLPVAENLINVIGPYIDRRRLRMEAARSGSSAVPQFTSQIIPQPAA